MRSHHKPQSHLPLSSKQMQYGKNITCLEKKVIVSFTCQPNKGSGDDKDPLPLPPAAASNVVIQDVVKVLFQRFTLLILCTDAFFAFENFQQGKFFVVQSAKNSFQYTKQMQTLFSPGVLGIIVYPLEGFVAREFQLTVLPCLLNCPMPCNLFLAVCHHKNAFTLQAALNEFSLQVNCVKVSLEVSLCDNSKSTLRQVDIQQVLRGFR